MAVINDYPVLDGICPSWADIIVKGKAPGVPLINMKDIAAINTGGNLEIGEQRGAIGGRVRKRTQGSVSYDATITFYRDGYQRVLRAFKAVAPLRGNQRLISLVHFGMQIQHTPPGDTEIYEVRLKGCRMIGRTLNSTEGTEADQVEVPLSVIEIVDMIDGEEVILL